MKFIFLSLLFVICSGATPDQRFEFKCEDYCEITGDGIGIVRQDKCGCWHEVDLKKEVIFVGTGVGAYIEGKKKPYYDQ